MEYLPQLILTALLWGVWAAVLAGGLYVTYFLLSLPLRRQERANLFLDLLEGSLRSGQTPEQAFTALARAGDASLGVRFHWMAALLEKGFRLDEALAAVPQFLPAQIRGLLHTGWQLGDVRKVLPLCRRVNADGASTVMAGCNYVPVVLLATSPFAAGLLITLTTWVVPKFLMIFKEMETTSPVLLPFIATHTRAITSALAGSSLLGFAVALLYTGGPRLTEALRRTVFPWTDAVAWGAPWKRLRLKRNFAGALALLIDEGVPEARALALAAESIPNAVLQRRAALAVVDLAQGRTLAEALGRIDTSGEFQWRLRNAACRPARLFQALDGWLESLDARAFQWEQLAAQSLTTALVLFNGVLVGTIVVAIFQPLIALTQGACLW